MLPKMWTRLSQIALLFFMLSLPLLNKKEDDPSKRKSSTQILDEAINDYETKYECNDESEAGSGMFMGQQAFDRQNSEGIPTHQNLSLNGDNAVASPLQPAKQKGVSLHRQMSTTSNRSSYRAKNSKKLRRSVESLGSSVKSAHLSESGVLVKSDLSLLKFREAYRE